jgi:hypothetical protein
MASDEICIPAVCCELALAKLVDASANATGSNILVPKLVFNECIKEYNANLSLPSNLV